MARSRVSGVAAAAVVVLLGAVIWVRADLGVTASDLVATPTPTPTVESLPSPRLPDEVLDPLVIGPDGAPELRIGMSARALEPWVVPPAPIAGCHEVDFDERAGWYGAAWLVDDVVASIRVVSVELTPSPVLDVRAWLGPTLGSGIEQASGLPGARTEVHRPFGRAGISVSVVVVPGGANEVVYTDAPHRFVRRGQEVGGRITSIEVRAPAARACSAQAQQDPLPLYEDRPVLHLDGVPTARLGSPLAELLAQSGVQEVTTGPSERCRAFKLDGAFGLQVLVVDEVVVALVAGPGSRTSLGVSPGDGLDEIRAGLPDLDGVADEELVGHVDVKVVDGGPTVRMHLGSGTRWVPDVETPLTGSPVVQAVSVWAPNAVDAERDC